MLPRGGDAFPHSLPSLPKRYVASDRDDDPENFAFYDFQATTLSAVIAFEGVGAVKMVPSHSATTSLFEQLS